MTPPQIIRDFRRHTGLTQHRLAELVGCTDDAIGGFERDGAPGWMRYALFGIGVKEVGLRAEVAAALVGIEPAKRALDSVPSAHSQGAPAPAARPRSRTRPDDRD